MNTIAELLDKVHLHDSTLMSLSTAWNGAVDLIIDIDLVWNKELDPTICGIRFPSVFEIATFKIDRMNTIGDVESSVLEDYDTSFVVADIPSPKKAVMVDFRFVAGGQLTLICNGEAEYIRKEAQPSNRAYR